jgi:hypothetical protein
MRIKKCSAIVLAAGLFFSMIVLPMGCVHRGTNIAQEPPLRGDDNPCYGSLLKLVLKGLAEGAAREVGGDAMGEILSLLGWGGGGNDQQYLHDMSQKLDYITTLLSNIQSELDELLKQLKIVEGDIIANANNPTIPINTIDSTHDDLKKLSQKKAGGVNPLALNQFDITVEGPGGLHIDLLVHDIGLAILPLTPEVTRPVLDNFVKLALDKGDDLTHAYLGLEQYFSKLLYYQLEGVNLIVEAKNYRDKANIPQNIQNAQEYLDDFNTTKLPPEVDNFINNVYFLILSRVDLVDSAHFLPSEAQEILSRAHFFRVQALNLDHFGLRGTFIATQDLVSSVITIEARNKQTGQVYSGTGTLNTVSGTNLIQLKTYDYWSGNKVQPSSDYTVIEYDFGDVPLGDYDILDGNGTVIGSATVQKFKDDYTVPQDGSDTINYGHFTISRRVGATDAFNNNVIWNWWSKNLNNTGANGSAAAGARYAGLKGSASNDQYSGDVELDANFIYTGSATTGLTINYSAHAYGKTQSSAIVDEEGSANSKIRYTIGIFDQTTGKVVHILKDTTKTTPDNGSESIDDPLQGNWFFPDPSPGHDYYIYFHCHIDGSSYRGSAGGNMTIDGIEGNVYITF